MKAAPHGRYGFSVLEMLIAVAIAGILLAIGVVNLRAPAARLFANDLKAQIEQARFEAIRRNAPVAVRWEAADGRFATRLDPTSTRVPDTCDGSSVLVTRQLDEYRNVTVDVSQWSGGVVWLPSGQGRTCTGAPAIGGEIEVTDGRTTRVVAVSVGGRVSIR